jgi:hypothetical protein
LSRISSWRPGERLNWSQVYLGVALTTLATLVLELALTRIFSVVFYYHFAFLAISIALFGLGAGGVFSYVAARGTNNLFSRLGSLAALTSLVVVGSLWFVLSRRDDSNLTIGLIYFACALPFLLSGAIVALAISRTIERVDRVYFSDLLGAAIGCMILVPLLNSFGGPNTVLSAAVLFAVSSSIWFSLGSQPIRRAAAVTLALALATLITVNVRQHFIDVKFAKGSALKDEAFVKWNSFSRIAVRPDRYTGKPEILIDADASTGIADFDFEHLSETERADLTRQGPAFAYQLRPGAKTLIIGPGGGWDVSRAIVSGSHDITGVEINPIIATTVMRKLYAAESRRLYFRPEVHIFVEDGRSFVRRSQEKYDVLQATLVDTWASTAAGAFALSENNLYTTEAFYDYLSHLTDNGILSFTRWGFVPPRESLRLLTLARVALARLGENDIARHVIVVREGGKQELDAWGARDTVIVSRKPLSAEDVAKAEADIKQSNLHAVYLPGGGIANEFTAYLTSTDPQRFLREYPYDISPVSDDRPFFFYTVQPRDLVNFFTSRHDMADYKVNRAVPLLFGVLAISLLATAIVLVLPPLVLGSQLPRDRSVLRFLLYFAAIGAGYILIQVALIQKFVLFLGHPTYALTVIIFSMLVFSGLGSLFSRRITGPEASGLSVTLALVAVVVVLLALIATPVTEIGITWPLGVKIAASVLFIAPAGFLMGIPFPTGLTLLEKWHHESIRWAWSLNAAASVLGSALSMFLAIYLGLRATLICGALLYIAALSVWTAREKAPHESALVSKRSKS